jgi:hypothetical protein
MCYEVLDEGLAWRNSWMRLYRVLGVGWKGFFAAVSADPGFLHAFSLDDDCDVW